MTVLALLAGGLTAGNLAKLPHPNSTSALEPSAAPVSFALYTLDRKTGKDRGGAKKPDTIRGTEPTGSSDGTIIVTAPRIQEYAALPSALAVVTLNDDNTSSLEIVPLTGGPATLVALPASGTVENLKAATSEHLVGFTFTSSTPSSQHSKTLYVYDINDPSAGPRAVQGLNGTFSAIDWRFVPGTSAVVAQAPDSSLFLMDTAGTGKVSPLGAHGGILGFVSAGNELAVMDAGLNKGVDPPRYMTINLASGTPAPLSLPGQVQTGLLQGNATTVSQPVLLDPAGGHLQSVSTHESGKESSTIILNDRNGSRTIYQPAPEWSRVQDFCLSPSGDFLAVETAAPQYVGDQYPVRPAPSPMQTDVVDLKSGTITKTVPGFLPNWCD